MKKNKKKISPGIVALYVILVILELYYLIPLLVMVSTSFKEESEALKKTWEWIPKPFTFENYVFIIDRYPFLRWTINSIIVTVGTVALTCFTALPAGYAFARLNFRGKNLLFTMCLLTIMIPFYAYMPQLYLLFYRLKMLNTYIGLMIPLSVNAFAIFLFRQFIVAEIPRDIEDAAKIDGCSYWGILFRIVLPLIRPAMTTAVLFTAFKSWNYLMWPLVATSGDKVKTLPVGLAVNVFGVTTGIMHQPPYTIVMAGALLSIIIPVVLFIFLQRFFVRGIVTSGLKQ